MATSQHDADWQSTKNTVLERSRHMFNNPFLSDVVFSCEGSDKKFFAHKYVLATSSAVFYAMFYGKLAEKNSVVNLSDTTEEILEEFLRFLYTDECNLTTDNVMFVLYLAKKYIVPSLLKECIEFLEENFAVENVVTIMLQSIEFDEEKLEKKCWDFIDLNTTRFIASSAFAEINLATLEKLLERETLNVKEADLFKAVLKWSEAECSRKGIEANSKNKRDVMGNAIDQIRFTSMTLQEFGQNVSKSGILTPEENISFFEKFSGVERESSEKRTREKALLRCSRFKSHCSNSIIERTGCNSFTTHSLCVSFGSPVNFYGVRLLGCGEKDYSVTLDVYSQSVSKKCRSQLDRRGVSGFDVMLPVPIQVKANVVVQLQATIFGFYSKGSGSRGAEQVKANSFYGVTVFFFNTAGRPGKRSGTTVEEGQFDEIIFTKI